ncbi:unnamed protein product [Dicrocoelium dendriticum]|nr:unnamed protein product [Dicrocoelium dendriticum]
MRNLRLTAVLNIYGAVNAKVACKAVLLPSVITHADCEIFLDTSDMEIMGADLKLLTLYCHLPLFLQHTVSHIHSPRQCYEIRRKTLRLDLESCNCTLYSRQKFLRIHHCVSGLLIGQWKQASIAFVHFPFDLVQIRSVLRHAIADGSKSSEFHPSISSTETVLRTKDLLDLNATLTLTNGAGHILLSSTWRNFDITEDHCLLLSNDDWGFHIPFDHHIQANLKVGSLDVLIEDVFVVKFQAYNTDGLCIVNLVYRLDLINSCKRHTGPVWRRAR